MREVCDAAELRPERALARLQPDGTLLRASRIASFGAGMLMPLLLLTLGGIACIAGMALSYGGLRD